MFGRAEAKGWARDAVAPVAACSCLPSQKGPVLVQQAYWFLSEDGGAALCPLLTMFLFRLCPGLGYSLLAVSEGQYIPVQRTAWCRVVLGSRRGPRRPRVVTVSSFGGQKWAVTFAFCVFPLVGPIFCVLILRGIFPSSLFLFPAVMVSVSPPGPQHHPACCSVGLGVQSAAWAAEPVLPACPRSRLLCCHSGVSQSQGSAEGSVLTGTCGPGALAVSRSPCGRVLPPPCVPA